MVAVADMDCICYTCSCIGSTSATAIKIRLITCRHLACDSVGQRCPQKFEHIVARRQGAWHCCTRQQPCLGQWAQVNHPLLPRAEDALMPEGPHGPLHIFFICARHGADEAQAL